MLPQVYSKELRKIIEKIRMPSAQCQACLSDKSHDKDIIFTCQICQSSIHNKHYGREIQQNNQFNQDKWYCERCRMICLYAQNMRYKQIQDIQCHFCPNSKGILKRVFFNSNNTTKIIWIHPQCSTWTFPLIFQKNNRRTHYNSQYPSRPTGKFWINLQNQAISQCQICQKEYGYKIKCMYYACNKFYHCSCAKTIGLIRDLQSMHFQNDIYIPPYCQEHLQKRVLDCSAKIQKYKQLKDEGKASHFKQLMNSYQLQLKNMENSAKKYQQQEQLRLQMQYQVGQIDEIMEDISFSDQQGYQSEHPEEFYDFIFDEDYPKIKKEVNPILTSKLNLNKFKQTQKMQIEEIEPYPVKQQPQELNIGQLLKRVTEERPAKIFDRESQRQEQSQWHSSQQIQSQFS